MITGRQAKAAREMLGWSRTKLASKARVAQSTVSNLEAKGHLSPRLSIVVQDTLEAAGVIFMDQNGDGPGVRMQKNYIAAPRRAGANPAKVASRRSTNKGAGQG